MALGVIGIFLPLLPTTVFLLLAAWCFARSSKRFHDWLLSHSRLGPMIKAWQDGQGIPRRTKYRVIALIWLSMSVSMLVIAKLWATILLVTIGSTVTLYLLRLPVSDATRQPIDDISP